MTVPHTTQPRPGPGRDVAGMVASMVNSSANFEFVLRLQNETPLNSRIFVSGFNTAYPDKRPGLVITYHP